MKISRLHETIIKGSYLAVVLTPTSKNTLLEWWRTNVKTPFLDRVIAHHVTLKYNPDDEDLHHYQVGQDVQIEVTGYVADDLAQVVTVDCPVQSCNAHPHITVAVNKNTLPSISKKILASAAPVMVNGPALNGVIEHVLPSRLHEEKKTDFGKERKSGLHGWFSRKGGEGKSGWVDCNTCRTDPKTGKKTCKPCGRQKGEKRAYPACRPTPADCGTTGRGTSWGKKSG